MSEMCSESGCLAKVVAAMRANWMTSRGADGMDGICESVASGGVNASSANRLSTLLHKIPASRLSKSDEEKDNEKKLLKLECQEEVCDIKELKTKLCDEDKDKADKCYKFCCEKKKMSGGCFAGESTVDVQGRGSIPLAQLRVGDQVLVEERQGQLAYEPVLSFLHVVRPASGTQASFLTVVHRHGEFQATGNHIVFVSGSPEEIHDTSQTRSLRSRVSKLVGKLAVGDELVVSLPGSPRSSTSSRVLEVRRSSGQLGMYAPLTPSGTIVVDGVVASNYASPSLDKDLTHHTAHVFLFPVRLYHMLALRQLLAPFWRNFCGHSRYWLCQGDNLNEIQSLELHEVEELHPYLTVMYRGLQFDRFL